MTKRTCGNCRYWSEMCAQSIGCGPIEALCLNSLSPKAQEYTREKFTCDQWASNHHGAVDERGALARYEVEEVA